MYSFSFISRNKIRYINFSKRVWRLSKISFTYIQYVSNSTPAVKIIYDRVQIITILMSAVTWIYHITQLLQFVPDRVQISFLNLQTGCLAALYLPSNLSHRIVAGRRVLNESKFVAITAAYKSKREVTKVVGITIRRTLKLLNIPTIACQVLLSKDRNINWQLSTLQKHGWLPSINKSIGGTVTYAVAII